MKLLLDTHAFLWFIAGSDRLSRAAREVIEDAGNERWFSVAGLWEIAIKHSLGKLECPRPIDRFLLGQLKRNWIQPLPVEAEHAVAVNGLEWHHRDPFDRLMIAQALSGELVAVTADDAWTKYGVKILW